MLAVQCEFWELFVLVALIFYFSFSGMVKSLHCKYVLPEIFPSRFVSLRHCCCRYFFLLRAAVF